MGKAILVQGRRWRCLACSLALFTALSGCGTADTSPTKNAADLAKGKKAKAKDAGALALREWKKTVASTVATLATKHNGIAYLPKRRADADDVEHKVYTIELQDALIRDDRRPVVAVVTVDDVLSKDGKTYINLLQTTGLEFLLSCPRDFAQRVIQESRKVMSGRDKEDFHPLPRFAVVAVISRVERSEANTSLNVTTNVTTAEDLPDAVNETDAKAVVDPYAVATGQCLELVFLGWKPLDDDSEEEISEHN